MTDRIPSGPLDPQPTPVVVQAIPAVFVLLWSTGWVMENMPISTPIH